jgi:hypothetical protein
VSSSVTLAWPSYSGAAGGQKPDCSKLKSDRGNRAMVDTFLESLGG